MANGSKTQLSQIAREKHELEVRVKRAEGAEVELKRLTEVNKNLEISNVSLRVCLLLFLLFVPLLFRSPCSPKRS